MKKAIAIAVFLLFTLLAFVRLAAAAGHVNGTDMLVLRIADRQVISFARMIREISGPDVILIGESHGSVTDHRMELDIIRALHASVAPLALGMEMFRADSQRELDGWVTGDIPLESFRKVYHDNWEMPWSLYSGILLYARQVRMPVFGLNVPTEISDKVFEHGFDSLSPAEKKGLPAGITCTVDEEYMRYIREMYRFHAGMGGQSFYDFCQAQMLWDSVMARNIVETLKRMPGMKMVVIAGVGHAWKRGIPAQIGKISDYRCVVVLPAMPNGKSVREITTSDADYILLGRE